MPRLLRRRPSQPERSLGGVDREPPEGEARLHRLAEGEHRVELADHLAVGLEERRLVRGEGLLVGLEVFDLALQRRDLRGRAGVGGMR